MALDDLAPDQLLGQLSAPDAVRTYAQLQASAGDRAWAEAVAEAISPLVSGSLPEIPVGAALGADAPARGGLERDSHPSSRRGGAILLGAVGTLIAAVILVVALTGGAAKPHRVTGHGGSGTTAQTVPRNAATGTSFTPTPQILAQLNLSSPTGASARLGVAQVIREAGVVGVVIDAQGIPANTAHDAYAVWLSNSAASHTFVGFVHNLVGRNGRLSAEGELPADAAAFHRLLITLETRQRPDAPGEVVLSGPFREHP